MPKIMSGGGYGSRQHTEAKKGKQEPISHKGNPAGVAQQGLATQFQKEPITSGIGYQPYGPKGHTAQGPGANRTIYKSGSQSPTPQAREMAAGRDILSEYGRDIPGKGKR